MSGCFSNSSADRFFESQLNAHLDAGEAEEHALELAIAEYGEVIFDEDGLYVFENGAIGCPTMVEDADEDGYYWSLGGLTECDVVKTKNGGYIVKVMKLVPSKRKSPKRYRGHYKEVVDFFMRINP